MSSDPPRRLARQLPEDMAATFWGDPDIELEIMAKALKDNDSETVEKLQGYLPGKKQAMFTPIPEDQSMSKREIDEAKAPGKVRMKLEPINAVGTRTPDDVGLGAADTKLAMDETRKTTRDTNPETNRERLRRLLRNKRRVRTGGH